MEEPKTGPAQMTCRACGESFAPQKMVAMIRDKLGMAEEVAETCPRCRRAGLAQGIEDSFDATDGASCGGAVEFVIGRRAGPCDKE